VLWPGPRASRVGSRSCGRLSGGRWQDHIKSSRGPAESPDPIRKRARLAAHPTTIEGLETDERKRRQDFFVLDLKKRTATRLRTTSSSKLAPAPTSAAVGLRRAPATDLAQFRLGTLTTTPVDDEPPNLFGLRRQNSGGGPAKTRSIALPGGAFGSDVVRSGTPDPATSRPEPRPSPEEP